jgi:hypothetical protein
VKLWLNNNSLGSPNAQDIDLSGVPGEPGGTASWVKDNLGYDRQFYLGNQANTGTMVGSDFILRLMDLELDGQFDSAWSSGGSQSAPIAPTNLRIVP